MLWQHIEKEIAAPINLKLLALHVRFFQKGVDLNEMLAPVTKGFSQK